VETIRDRAEDHRDRKCRETDGTRDGDFKIKQDTKTPDPDNNNNNINNNK